MSLKGIMQNMKQEGYVVKAIDSYLLSLNHKDNDRATNVNSPSQASVCLRANYYARNKYDSDGSLDPRSFRIFNNGDGVHDRLQNYLEKSGILLMREVPIINDPYQIQGHTDGYLTLAKKRDITTEVGILEIKSINSNGFTNLKAPKDEHIEQAMVYLYASEERRLYLRKKYKTEKAFNSSIAVHNRKNYYKKHYQHFKSGSKYSKEEKVQMQIDLGLRADKILWNCPKPVTKCIFLYECKDNQELKEYVVVRDEEVIERVLDRFEQQNGYCERQELPPREGTSKSCGTCKWCNYKIECWL